MGNTNSWSRINRVLRGSSPRRGVVQLRSLREKKLYRIAWSVEHVSKAPRVILAIGWTWIGRRVGVGRRAIDRGVGATAATTPLTQYLHNFSRQLDRLYVHTIYCSHY